jgi:tripartite ATP-independent transporter DctM subunit
MMLIIFMAMFLLFFLGAPMAFGILTACIGYLFCTGDTMNLIAVSSEILFSSDVYVLLAVPFFMLAAELMNESNITDDIFDFAKTLVGRIPGGLGHVNVIASMIFAGMSGSGLADTAGLGKVEIKAMKDAGYDPAFSASVTAASAIIGPIIPPSICMVIGAVVTNTSVGRMLLGGIIPGILMGLVLMLIVYYLAIRRGYPRLPKQNFGTVFLKFKKTFPALLTPFILVGGIVSGVFTPTEAAVIACMYAFVLSVFFYRAFGIKKLFRIFIQVGANTGGLLFVLSAARGFGLLATRTQVPQKLLGFINNLTTTPEVTMFIIVGVLILLGMIMEDVSLLVIMGPLLLPVVLSMGIDPVYFGVILVFTLQLAMITPPVGMGFYITIHYADIDIWTYSKEIVIFFLSLVAVVILMVLFPRIITWAPDLVFGTF